MVFPRIDPKTRRLIVTDFTPSVKGEIITLQQYADAMLFTLLRIQEELEESNGKLKDMRKCLGKMSNLDFKED